MIGSLNLRDHFLMCLVKWKDDKFQRICNNFNYKKLVIVINKNNVGKVFSTVELLDLELCY